MRILYEYFLIVKYGSCDPPESAHYASFIEPDTDRSQHVTMHRSEHFLAIFSYFSNPISFFIYSSISTVCGTIDHVTGTLCSMSEHYTTNSIFPYLSSKDVENI